MRSLIWKGATVAIIVMSSGTAAGQKQSGVMRAILITPLPNQARAMPIAFNHTSVVDRIFSFDANGDHRIARDELPERMEGLVSRGDHNQDGFLSRAEVIALVDRRPSARQVERFTARGAPSLAEIIADLKLPPATHDRAMEIVTEHTGSRNINDRVKDDLYAAMRELLDNEDYENFVAAATRLRNTPRVFVGGIVGGGVGTPASPPR
jgi:hypothetical protein